MEYIRSLAHPEEIWAIIKFKYFGGKRIVEPKQTSHRESTEEFTKCYQYLTQTSRSFSAVIRAIHHDTLRPTIVLFYLILRSLDTIEDDTALSIPTRRDLLTNFYTYLYVPEWRFTESQEKDRIVLEQFPVISAQYRLLDPTYRDAIRDITQQMGEGFALYLDKDILTVEDWNNYCYYAAGLVGVGLARLFVISGVERPEIINSDVLPVAMGLFLQKTNIIRDYWEDTLEARYFWPQEVWCKYAENLEDFMLPSNAKAGLECLNELITNALCEVPNCIEFLSGLQDASLFNFCAIPQVMAVATLALCYNNANVLTSVVKIRRGETVALMQEGTSINGVKKIFSRYARAIKRNIPPTDANSMLTARILDHIIEICNNTTHPTTTIPTTTIPITTPITTIPAIRYMTVGLALLLCTTLINYRLGVHHVLLNKVASIIL